MQTVLVKSIPNALVMFIPVLVIMMIKEIGIITMTTAMRNSIAMVVVTVVGFINLIALCRPFTKWRAGVCTIVGVGMVIVSLISVYIGYIIPKIPVDFLHLFPAFENIILFFGMLGMSISLSLLLHLFLPDIERLVYKAANKVDSKIKSK